MHNARIPYYSIFIRCFSFVIVCGNMHSIIRLNCVQWFVVFLFCLFQRDIGECLHVDTVIESTTQLCVCNYKNIDLL